MKKILVLVNNDIGLYNFRREILKRLMDDGYEVYISLPDGPFVPSLIEVGCKFLPTLVDRRGVNPIKDFKLFLAYRKYIKEVKPDLVMTYTIKPNIYGGLNARMKGIPYITNITGLGTAFQNENMLKKIIVFLYKAALKRATAVTFQNTENLETIVNNRIYNGETIIYPGSGVNLKHYQELPFAPKNTVDFLFIARIMKEKGIDEYLEAAKIIKREHPDYQFHILGDIEESQYEEILQEMSDQKIIQYHGFTTNTISFIEKADCIVLPSYHEGMSNVLLESAACGRPLITSNVSGCKETVTDNLSGFLVEVKSAEDLADKMLKFAELNDEQKKEMGHQSRLKIENEFDRNIIVEANSKLVGNIING